MTLLNAVLRPLVDGLLGPFRDLPPLVGLAVVSLVVAVGLLVVFKRTSDQEGLAATRRQIHACLFEIRLFNDDLRAILRAQVELLGHNLRYLRLSLVPMLWSLVPLALLVAQLQFHYGYRGLEPGAPTLLEVVLAPDAVRGGGRPAATLDAPPGIRVETEALWIPARRELAWRIAAVEPGEHRIDVGIEGVSYAKSARAQGPVARRSPLRLRAGLLNQLLYPAEDPLPAGGAVESIRLGYPEASFLLRGHEIPWWLVFLALTMAFAFLLKGPLGVVL